MEEEEIRRKFGDLVEKGVFNPVARFINNDPEERLAEGIAQAFECYRKKALEGIEMETAVLVCCCRRRATDLGRHLVRGGQRLKDPLDPRAFHLGRVEILHLDGIPQDNEMPDEGDPGLEAVALEGLSTDPANWIQSALDLESWLDRLPAEDRKLLELRQRGHTFKEIGAQLGLTISRACQRVRALGFELAHRMGVTIHGCRSASTCEVTV